MPVPSYRVPVRVARGTLAALTAGLGDLQEGELCYATDENILYVIEGGVLTATVADLTGVELVNDTTPQLGGSLDTNGFQIISTAAGNIQVAPDTTGVLEVMGNTGNDAAIQLNCEANTHGIKLKSPPHSAAASYTLVFPNDTGASGQALTTDGAGIMSWTTPSTVGSINDLTDVDTVTAAPTNGQALVWDNVNSEWVPGNVAADLAATSIDALQDVDTTTAAPTTNQVLSWDGTSWVPADQSGGGGGGDSSGVVLVNNGLNTSGDYNFSPFVVDLGANLQVGDLAVIQANVRAGGDPNTISDLVIPTGWTRAAFQDFVSTSATTADCQSNILYKYLDESDIATGSVSLNTTASDPGDDWFVQPAVFRNAVLSSTAIADSTLTGSLLANGYDFTGISAPVGGFNFVTATNIYAFSTTSGVEVTPATGTDLGWLNGSNLNNGYEENVVRRISSLLGTGSLEFNIKVLNNTGVPADLSDGFHIMVATIGFASPAITSISGGTFGSGV